MKNSINNKFNDNIKRAMERITPSDEQKERMLAGINRMLSENRNSSCAAVTDIASERAARSGRRVRVSPLRIAVAAAVICCLLTASVFAEDIGNYFSGMLTREPVVSESVATGVYYDSDGHVEMTVEELLTDRSVIRAVAHYHAIDDEGAAWLAEFDDEKILGYLMNTHSTRPDRFEVYSDKIVSGGFGAAELVKYRTDTDRYYRLDAECLGKSMEKVWFSYPLTGGFRQTELDITKEVKTETYRVNTEPVIFTVENYECSFYPTEVVISNLSVSVNGKQNGICYWYKDGDNWGGYTLVPAEAEIVKSLYLVDKEGGKLALFDTPWNNKGPDVDDDAVVATSFTSGPMQQSYYDDYEVDDYIFSYAVFSKPINTDDYVGIEFNGEYFPFEK